MTNTNSVGRPAVGGAVHVRLGDALVGELDAWATARGMSRAEAIRHLIVTGMAIGDAARTMATVGQATIESMFPEAEDLEEAWELIEGEQMDSFGTVETHDDRPYNVTIGATLVRGKWLVYSERFDGGDYEHVERTATVHDNRDGAYRAYLELLVNTTGELWSEGEGPLWGDGIYGDCIGLDEDILWRGLIPDASVMEADELAAAAAGPQALDAFRAKAAAELAAWEAEQRRPVDPEILADRRCPRCDSKGMVVAGRPVPHVCAGSNQVVPESEMNPKHYA
ncbi:CopG family transcriptional regulator [Glycomyces artemisiae]|uniref:Ribbon-helix-helix CopG family protein n=1 Tax=Glycomyces artemisiae TaxID=1076443 RepID=A0A2T0U6H9_9ACTN|nr:CopG family transcriptional regulator [Glycomyces artemisiae]PRY53504.1 ribbon-helix-helix CopG family protein [Glycomyces artemisiae]